MSLPPSNHVDVEVKVRMTATDAIALARQILHLLGKAGEYQAGEIVSGRNRPISETDYNEDHDANILGMLLGDMSLGKGVKLCIIPDRRPPNSSEYSYYTSPADLD